MAANIGIGQGCLETGAPPVNVKMQRRIGTIHKADARENNTQHSVHGSFDRSTLRFAFSNRKSIGAMRNSNGIHS
jgi:hypothetical protein